MKNTRQALSLPNCVTALRIAGTVALLGLNPLSPAFFIVYTFCGITDILDGVIARATHTASEFGAKLDSIADLLFYTVMILRIFPVLWVRLPRWIWVLLGVVLFVRLISYLTAAIKYRRFASLHTYLNKLTGIGVFLIPYFLMLPIATVYCTAVCIVAGIASAEELLIHLRSGTYEPGKKSLCK